jgi:hypothetical protein
MHVSAPILQSRLSACLRVLARLPSKYWEALRVAELPEAVKTLPARPLTTPSLDPDWARRYCLGQA